MATAEEMLAIVLLGAVLGTVGQLARVVVGLKKMRSKEDDGPWWDEFSFVRLAASLLIAVAVGSTAGVLYLLNVADGGLTVSEESLMAVVGAGYAGTDFIEGFIQPGN